MNESVETGGFWIGAGEVKVVSASKSDKFRKLLDNDCDPERVVAITKLGLSPSELVRAIEAEQRRFRKVVDLVNEIDTLDDETAKRVVLIEELNSLRPGDAVPAHMTRRASLLNSGLSA